MTTNEDREAADWLYERESKGQTMSEDAVFTALCTLDEANARQRHGLEMRLHRLANDRTQIDLFEAETNREIEACRLVQAYCLRETTRITVETVRLADGQMLDEIRADRADPDFSGEWRRRPDHDGPARPDE